MTQKPARVLCVEDNALLCETLQAVMSSGERSLRLDFAHDGEAAMNRLLDESTAKDPYALVILDVRVPRRRGDIVDDTLGLKVLYSILDQQHSFSLVPPGTPIVVYTAFPSYDDCVECMRRGAADYIPKTDLDSDKNNVEILNRRCRELAYPGPPTPSPITIWLDSHLDSVVQKYGGSVIGLVRKELETGLPVIGDFAVLQGSDYDDVRRKMLVSKELRWEKPYILNVPLREEVESLR